MSGLRLAPEALVELHEAASWYTRSTGLDLEIRRALLPRFPYALVFLSTEVEIQVIAVAHNKRLSGYWLQRIQ